MAPVFKFINLIMKKEKKIPKEFIAIAQHHASKRTAMNEKVRKGIDSFYASNPSKADFIGVLGEMIAGLEMMKKGKAFFFNALYDEKQLPGADLIVDDYRIDVKTTTKNDFCVPVYKVEKSKSLKISHYWIIKINIEKQTYLQLFYSVDDVLLWPIEERYKKKVHVKMI